MHPPGMCQAGSPTLPSDSVPRAGLCLLQASPWAPRRASGPRGPLLAAFCAPPGGVSPLGSYAGENPLKNSQEQDYPLPFWKIEKYKMERQGGWSWLWRCSQKLPSLDWASFGLWVFILSRAWEQQLALSSGEALQDGQLILHVPSPPHECNVNPGPSPGIRLPLFQLPPSHLQGPEAFLCWLEAF